MTDNETFLQETQEDLTGVLRPFKRELNRRQRMADFLNQCIRCASRNDFLQLDELLKSKIANDMEQDDELDTCKDPFDLLRKYANEQVERYRMQFIEDLTNLAEDADLPMDIDFPRFSSIKGIEGEIDFSRRFTTINKKILKSIDPRRIITAVQKVKRQLYDRPYDPQAFIDNLYQNYSGIMARENGNSPGHPVPIQRFYLDYVLTLQSKPFFQNMEKGKFREYTLDQFAVDLWRYFQSEIKGTSDGYALQLRPGRNSSLWLIDSDGERRQITGISFQRPSA